MLPLLGIAFLILLAFQVALAFLPTISPRLLGRSPALLAEFAQGLALSVLLTPIVIAVHRRVLMGEPARHYALALSAPRFRRFLALTILLETAFLVSRIIGLLVSGTPARGMVLAVVNVLILYLSCRILILFPAIAIDAPGANWERAMQDSRGQALHIFLALIAALVPIIAATALLLVAASQSGIAGPAVVAVLGAAGTLAGLAVGAAAASRLYRALADAMEAV